MGIYHSHYSLRYSLRCLIAACVLGLFAGVSGARATESNPLCKQIGSFPQTCELMMRSEPLTPQALRRVRRTGLSLSTRDISLDTTSSLNPRSTVNTTSTNTSDPKSSSGTSSTTALAGSASLATAGFFMGGEEEEEEEEEEENENDEEFFKK